MVESIEFYDKDKNAPIDNLTGEPLKWLIQHSQLIRNIIDSFPGEKHLVIPVSFPTDRVQLFRKLIRGLPVGFYNRKGIIELYPLGPLEERNIENTVGNSPKNVQEERAKVLKEVVDYLILDEDLYPFFVELNNMRDNSKRLKNTRKRLINRPTLNENTIYEALENHKNRIYTIYHKDAKKRLPFVMNYRNIKVRNKILNNARTRKEKQLKNLNANIKNQKKAIENFEMKYRHNRSGWVDNTRDSMIDHLEYLEDIYANENAVVLPFTNSNNQNSTYNWMTPVEYEQFLRSQ